MWADVGRNAGTAQPFLASAAVDFPRRTRHTGRMKFLPLLVLLVLSLGSGPLQAADETKDLLAEGQRAMVRGDIATARMQFQMVLELDPKNTVARNYMRTIEAQEARQGGNGQLAAQLKALILPRVEFRDATFSSALDYLKQQALKASNGSIKVNFAVQLPQELMEKKITLTLASVPFTEALRYACDGADAKYVIERFAVVIRPRVQPGSETAEGAVQ
jgi:hypothetical protein